MEQGTKKIRKSSLLLFILFIFMIAGCSASPETQQLGREKDQEFDQGSGVEFSSLSEQKIADLAKLSKVWGMVKYYHPKVVSGDVNWDYELFRVMPSILEEDSDVNSMLHGWVHSLGSESIPGELEQQFQFAEESIQLRSSTDWCKDEEYLGTDLSFQLSKLLDSNISARDNAFVSFKSDPFLPSMEHENPYPNMNFNDTGYRLLSLFRYWSIIEYYYPYKEVIGEDWDQVLLEFIPKMIEGSDYDSYLTTLAELTTKIHDSHAFLIGKNKEAITDNLGTYRLPVNFIKIDHQIVISKVINPCGLEVGDIILKVDGKNIDELLENRRRYISQSREDTASLFYLDLFRTQQKNTDVTVTRQGKSMDISAVGSQQVIQFQIDTKSQAMENDEIYYINAGLLKDGEIDKIMKKWWNTKGLIVDLRNYPSSSLTYELAQYLIPSEKEFAVVSAPNHAIPGEFYYLEPLVSGGPEATNNEVYKGRLVILINENTISQGEFATMSLRNTENSIVLGRPSAGTDGNIRFIVLPGNIKTAISGVGIFHPDKSPTQRIGLQPDIHLDPTLEGIMEGKDEYIERAVELIKGSD